MRFSRPAHLQICLYSQTLTSNIRTDEPIQVKLIYLTNFAMIFQMTSNGLTQMLDFPTWIPDSESHSPAHLDFFLSFNARIYSAVDFPPLGISDHVVVSASIDFLLNSKRDSPFHRIAYKYSCADRDSLRDHLRDVPWEYIFKLSASAAAASEFVSGFRLELMYISLIQSIRLSLTHLHGFQVLVLLPQFIEITFFVCTKRINPLFLK